MANIAIPSDPREIYDRLCQAGEEADPLLCSLGTTRWAMDLDWYKAVRRAYLSPEADDGARDESKWVPDPGDMVLGRRITVTEDGGAPRLVDGRVQDANR